MSRRRRLVLWVVASACLLVAVAIGLLVVAGPRWLRGELEQRLHAAGWPKATVASVSWWKRGIEVHGLALVPGGTLTCELIAVDVLTRRVALSGLSVRLPTWDVAPLLPHSTATAASEPPTIPIAELTVADARIAVADLDLAVAAQVVRLAPRQVWMQLTTTRDTARIHVDGTIDLGGPLDLHAVADAVPMPLLADLTRQIRPGLWPADLTLAAGELALDSRLRWPGAEAEVKASAAWQLSGTATLRDVDASTSVAERPLRMRAQQLSAWFDANPERQRGGLALRQSVITSTAMPGVALTIAHATADSDGERVQARADLAALGMAATVDATATIQPDRTLSDIASSLMLRNVPLALGNPWLPTGLALSGTGAAQLTLSGNPAGPWHAQGQLTVPGFGLRLADGEASATTARLDLDGTWAGGPWRGADDLHGVAVLHLDGGSLRIGDQRIERITGSLPWGWQRDAGIIGHLHLDGITAAGRSWGEVIIKAAGRDRRVAGAATAEIAAPLRIGIDGWCELSTPLAALTAEVAVNLPRTVVTDGALLRTLAPVLGQTAITGGLSAAGTFRLAEGRFTPHLRLALDDAAINVPASQLTVAGLTTAATITSFAPFATAGEEPMSFRSASIGTQRFGAGRVQVALDLPRSVTLEEADFAWCGGRIGIPTLRVDLPASTAAGTVQAQHLDLAQLCTALAPDQVEGSGLLSGELPLTLGWSPSISVRLGRASIAANPPSGWLRARDRAQVQRMLGEGGQDPRIVSTVSDFDFNRLSITAQPGPTGESLIQVLLAGRGRGPDGLPIGSLTVNVGGAEDALAQALFLRGGGASMPSAGSPELDEYF